MTDNENIQDIGGPNTRNAPFPGLGTPTPSAPEPQVPAVDTMHRNFDAGGQATPIIQPEQVQPEQPIAQQQQPVTQQEQPVTPDYKLWQQLNKSELYTKDYNSFKNQFNNTASIDKLHQQLSDLQLYTKSNQDFKDQFFQHLPSKEVTEAHSYINDYLNTPKANQAIDKITNDAFYNEYHQKQLQNNLSSNNKSDATRIQQPVPIRILPQIKEDRDAFTEQSKQDPSLLKKVLTTAKELHPEDAPALNYAGFVAHANTIPHSDAVVKYYGDQIKSGEYDFDFNTNQIVKPVKGMDAFFNGMTKHSEDQEGYDFYATHNDDDILKHLNEKGPNDPFKPVMKAEGGWNKFLEGQGANAAPLVKFGLPAALLNPFGGVAAAAGAAMGAYAGSEDFAHSAYKNTLEESYHDFMTQHPDADPHIALDKAKHDANVASLLAAGQGIALSAGGALAKEVEFSPVRYSKKNLNALIDVGKDIGSNFKTLAQHAVPEIAKQAGVAAAVKALNNAQQGKVTSSGVLDDAASMALFTAGMIALKIPGAFKGKIVSSAGKANLLDLYAKSPETMVDAGLANAIKNEALTPQQAGELKVEIEAHKKAKEGELDVHSTITPEAEALLKSVEDGGVPAFMTKNLLKIAKDNGIEPQKTADGKEEELTPNDVINKLKYRQGREPKIDTFEKPDLNNLSDVMKANYEKDPEAFLKEVADHAHGGVMVDGKFVSSRPGAEKEYGADLVKLATEKYPDHIIPEPKTEPSAEVGQTENTEVSEKPHFTVSTPNVVNVRPKEIARTDADIENRMLEIEKSPKDAQEFDELEKEMQRRERSSVFDVPLEKVNDAVDALMKKEKEQPNGWGSFIEKRDAAETKDVADKYLKPKDISDSELKKDFKDAVMGNPDTWYADGLKLRESMKEAANRGIETSELVAEVEKHFIKDHYTKEEARAVVARKLKPIFENIKNKENAIPIGSTTSPDVVEASGNSKEMGGRIPESGETPISQNAENQNQSGEQSQQAEQPAEQQTTGNTTQTEADIKGGGEETDASEGIGISKKAIFEQYGKKFEKTPMGWDEASKNAVSQLADDAGKKGTSVAKEAESQVAQMEYEIKKGNLSVSKKRVVAAALHLMNQEEHIDTISGRSANTPVEKLALATELEMATRDRDATLKVIDQMGSHSGYNLGLFSGLFSKDADGGVNIARKKMEGILGTTIPETLKDLEANTTMSASEKNKVRPYVEKLEKIKKDYDEAIANAKKSAPKAKEENVATYKDKAKAVADAFRKLKTKPFTFKDENGNEINVNTMGLDWNSVVEAGAKIIEKTGEIADGIAAAIDKIKDAEWYKGLSNSDKEKFANQLEAHYNEDAPKIVYTAEEKNVMRLEKKLDEIRQGNIKQAEEKRIPSAREKELNDEIFEAKKNAGLIPSKPLQEKPEATMTPAEKNIKRLEKTLDDLRSGIVKQVAEKRELTPEEKDLQEQIFEAKKNLGLVASKVMPKTDEESRLESAMKATQRSLDDYQRHLDNNVAKSKKPTASETEELKALREKRDKAKSDYDEMISTGVKPRNHQKGYNVKEDAKDAAIMFQKRKTEGQLMAVQRLAENQNRSWWSKAIDFNRSFLISGFKTLARVGEAGGAKLTVDPLAKLTTGNIVSLLPGLHERAVSPKTVGSGLESLIKFPSNKAALDFVKAKESAFDKATGALNKNPDSKSAQEAYMKAEMESAQAQIYRMIHGNIYIDAKELAKFGSTEFDQAMGGYSKVDPADLHGADKWLYYLNTMGRLHGVEKAPSARRALVEGYNTKLLEYQKQGLLLSAGTRMRALDMAYLDFLGGKYQEPTQLATLVNKQKGLGDQPKAKLLEKAYSAYLKVAIPVSKIAINITKQGVDASTIGTEGILKYMYETSKGMKLNKAEGLEYKNIYDKLVAGAEKIPETDKRYIHDVLSRGLFGLGLYLTTAAMIKNGSIQYGGEYDDKHAGNARRKYKGEDGKWYDDLDYGQWVIAGHKFGKFGSSVLNHLPQFLPVALAVNTHNVYQYEHEYTGSAPNRSKEDVAAHRFTSGGKRDTKESTESFWQAAKSDANEITARLPFNNVMNPLRIAQNLLSIPFTKDIGEHFDTDEKGNQIERKPNGILQQAASNVGLRKFVDVKKTKEQEKADRAKKSAAPSSSKPSLPPTQYNSN